MPSSHHYCTHYLTPLHCNAASDNLSEKAGQNFCKWTQLFEKFFPCSQFQDGQYHFEFCSYFWYPISIRWLDTIIWGETIALAQLNNYQITLQTSYKNVLSTNISMCYMFKVLTYLLSDKSLQKIVFYKKIGKICSSCSSFEYWIN